MTSYKSELCSHYKTYFKSLMVVRFGQCMDMSRIRTAAIFTTRTVCTVKLSSQLLHLRASFSLSGRTLFLSGRKVCHSFGLEGDRSATREGASSLWWLWWERFKELSSWSSQSSCSGSCESLWLLPLWTFKPRSDLEDKSHWSHLNCFSLGPGLWVKVEEVGEVLAAHEATGGRSLILHQALLIGKKWLQLLLLVCFPPLLLWWRWRGPWLGKRGCQFGRLQRRSNLSFTML